MLEEKKKLLAAKQQGVTPVKKARSLSQARIEELNSIQRSQSVQEIRSKFKGNSLPDSQEEFYMKLRKMSRADYVLGNIMYHFANLRGRETKENSGEGAGEGLNKFTPAENQKYWTLMDKKQILHQWWKTATKDKRSQAKLTKKDAEKALQHYNITELTAGEHHWSEWLTAIDDVFQGTLIVDSIPDFNSNPSTPERAVNETQDEGFRHFMSGYNSGNSDSKTSTPLRAVVSAGNVAMMHTSREAFSAAAGTNTDDENEEEEVVLVATGKGIALSEEEAMTIVPTELFGSGGDAKGQTESTESDSVANASYDMAKSKEDRIALDQRRIAAFAKQYVPPRRKSGSAVESIVPSSLPQNSSFTTSSTARPFPSMEAPKALSKNESSDNSIEQQVGFTTPEKAPTMSHSLAAIFATNMQNELTTSSSSQSMPVAQADTPSSTEILHETLYNSKSPKLSSAQHTQTNLEPKETTLQTETNIEERTDALEENPKRNLQLLSPDYTESSNEEVQTAASLSAVVKSPRQVVGVSSDIESITGQRNILWAGIYLLGCLMILLFIVLYATLYPFSKTVRDKPVVPVLSPILSQQQQVLPCFDGHNIGNCKESIQEHQSDSSPIVHEQEEEEALEVFLHSAAGSSISVSIPGQEEGASRSDLFLQIAVRQRREFDLLYAAREALRRLKEALGAVFRRIRHPFRSRQ